MNQNQNKENMTNKENNYNISINTDDLICPITKDRLVYPITLHCCGQTMEKSVVVRLTKCPMCRTTIDKNYSVNKFIANILEKINLKSTSEKKTLDSYLNIVKNNGLAIKNIKREYHTPTICDAALEQNLESIKYIEQTEDLCIQAVSKNGMILEYIVNKTEIICELAINQNPFAIEFVPEELKTTDLWFKAIMKNKNIFFLNKNPSEELCNKLIDGHEDDDYEYNLAYLIQFIENQEECVCLYAVENDGENIKYVKNQTLDICLEALREQPHVLQYIKEEYQTNQVCKYAIGLASTVLRFVINQTQDICLEALREQPHVLQYIKEEYQTNQVCKYAIGLDSKVLRFVINQTRDICMAAVLQNVEAINHINIMLDESFYIELIKEKPFAFHFIKQDDLTEDMCIEFVKHDGNNLQFIKNQTNRICETAIEQNARACKYVK